MPGWKRLFLTLINVWVEIPFTWIEPIRFKGSREFPLRPWKAFDFATDDGGLVTVTIDTEERCLVEEHTSMQYFGRRSARRSPIRIMRLQTFALVPFLLPVLIGLGLYLGLRERRTGMHRLALGVWKRLEPHLPAEDAGVWKETFRLETLLLMRARPLLGSQDARSSLHTTIIEMAPVGESAVLGWFHGEWLVAEAWLVTGRPIHIRIGSEIIRDPDAAWLVKRLLHRRSGGFPTSERGLLRRLGLIS